MNIKRILRETYDDTGLIHSDYIEVEDTTEQDIIDKEALLIQIYNELQELKNKDK
jgi:hypothetical protein